VVAANMRTGYLDGGDPLVTARLILGMIMSVSRWYRPNEPFTSQQIVATATRLVGFDEPPSGSRRSHAERSWRGARRRRIH
jgi:tetracycline repressor-like protein